MKKKTQIAKGPYTTKPSAKPTSIKTSDPFDAPKSGKSHREYHTEYATAPSPWSCNGNQILKAFL